MAKEQQLQIQDRGYGHSELEAVCLECIVSPDLRDLLRPHLSEDTCSFCERVALDPDEPVAVDFERLMDMVMGAVNYFYERSIENLMIDDDVTPRYDSMTVAEDLCFGAVSDKVLEAICEAIEPDEWNEDPAVIRPDRALSLAWRAFCEKVKHLSRFVFLSVDEESSDFPDEFTTAEILERLARIRDCPRFG